MKKKQVYCKNCKKENCIQPIKTADIMTFCSTTRPILEGGAAAIGKTYEVDMKSGKVGIFKCVDYIPAWNVNWGWYHLNFCNYKNYCCPYYKRTIKN